MGEMAEEYENRALEEEALEYRHNLGECDPEECPYCLPDEVDD